MNTKQNSKWWVDVGLFAIFITAFFLDFTGLALHQWMGAAAAAIALYHLVTHWNWVNAVTRRFIGQTSSKSRLYFLIDAALMLGFTTIAGAGLAISTWFNLPLADYETWRVIHIAASISTLLVTLLKIGLHWRWIVTVAKNALSRPAIPQWKPAPARVSSQPNRRGFLAVMGTAGVASVFALSNAAKVLQPPQVATLFLSPQPDAQAETNVASTANSTDSGPVQSVAATQPASAPAAPVVAATAATTATTVATATAIPPPTAATPSTTTSACSVRCQRGCSYPGRCRRYVDANGNNRCDLGECL